MLKKVASNVTHNALNESPEIHVLAIEDDEDDFYLLGRMLEQDATKTYVLESTDVLEAAIDILKSRKFDVVLLDLGLEKSQGIETLQRLLNEELTAPVIVLTGSNQVTLGEQAIKAGAEDFIPKFEASPSLISRSISYAIERHRLVVQLQNQALTDQLTQLPNRTAIYERLERLISDSERKSINFGVALVDLDGFKQVNDTLGHRAGDDLLRQISGRLQKNLRKTDMVARLGGDEFVILVTHYHSTEEFLRVLGKKQDYLKRPLAIYANGKVEQLEITASFGACEWQAPMSAQQLISTADKAMYRGKHGNNGIILGHVSDSDPISAQNL